MAEDALSAPSFQFGIENTMEMGLGDKTLLEGLLSPETSTTDPDNVIPIKNEDGAEPKKKKQQPAVPATKKEEEEEEEENPPVEDPDILSRFLTEEEDEDEDDENKKSSSSKKKVPESDDDEEEESAPSQFNSLSKDLFKLGVFTREENEEDVEINTPEEFLDQFNKEKQKGAIEMVNKFIGQFGEDYQNAFEAIFVKGVNPKDYFSIYNTAVSFANLDMTQEKNQEMVVMKSLMDQGFEEEDAQTEIEKLKNYGDLEATATRHHKVLVKKESAKLQQMEQKAEQELQQKAAFKQQYITNVSTILQDKLKTKEFDGIPLNPKLATELQHFLTVDKYKTATGETLTEFDRTILELKKPENHAMKVKIALLLKIMEKDPNLSTIQRVGVTKKTNELFGEVMKHNTKPSSKEKPNSWFQ